MKRLQKYTLEYNEKGNDWELQRDKTNRVVRRFDNKDDATKGGVLKKSIGSEGGSVKIQKMNGKYQEERTFPQSADPKKSKG